MSFSLTDATLVSKADMLTELNWQPKTLENFRHDPQLFPKPVRIGGEEFWRRDEVAHWLQLKGIAGFEP